METTVTTPDYEIKTSFSKSEDNDCVVRAFMTGFGIPYIKAHAVVEEHLNRKTKEGTFMVRHLNNAAVRQELADRGYKVEPHNTKYIRKYDGRTMDMNVRRFCKTYPKGTYIISTSNHAFTIKDGEVIDWANEKTKLQRKCLFAYKVESNLQLSFNF